MSDKISSFHSSLRRDAVTEEYKSDYSQCYGAKAAIVGRAGYVVCALWLPDQRYVTKAVPRGDDGRWTVRSIASTLRDLLAEYELQVDCVVVELPWLRADAQTVALLSFCQRAAVGWAKLHDNVMAKEIKLYVRAPHSFWTETYGPNADSHMQHPPQRSQDYVDVIDHFLLFAGADAGRIALQLERDEIEREKLEIA